MEIQRYLVVLFHFDCGKFDQPAGQCQKHSMMNLTVTVVMCFKLKAVTSKLFIIVFNEQDYTYSTVQYSTGSRSVSTAGSVPSHTEQTTAEYIFITAVVNSTQMRI